MLLFFLVLLVIFVLFLFGWKYQNQTLESAKNLPWQVSVTPQGTTKVLGVEIGQVNFKTLMHDFNLLAEPALFENQDGEFLLEGSFGKKKIGLLEARIIAEMDADRETLLEIKEQSDDKEATPSNQWKYTPSVKSVKEVINQLRVWRLVYLPVSDYDDKQISFFGKPEKTITLNESAQYLLFPTKSVAILWDKEGKEIFYYTAPKDFPRLEASLPRQKVMLIQ